MSTDFKCFGDFYKFLVNFLCIIYINMQQTPAKAGVCTACRLYRHADKTNENGRRRGSAKQAVQRYGNER